MKYFNNPLNIRTGSKWLGLCGNRNGFCHFSSIVYGIRAALYLLLKSYPKHGCLTIEDCINRWAPPFENNTSDYIKYVCRCSNLCASDIVTTLNFDKLFLVLKAMCWIESNYKLERVIFNRAYSIL